MYFTHTFPEARGGASGETERTQEGNKEKGIQKKR